MSIYFPTHAAGRSKREVVQVTNNCNLPFQLNTGSQWVHNAWTSHTAGPAGYSSIQCTFVNWYIATDQESQGFYDFNLRAAICVDGVFYPLLFGGQRDVLVPRNFGEVTSDPLDIYIPPGKTFFVTNRRVAADAGAAGTYTVLGNTSGITERQDGLITGTNASVDYTTGTGVAWGAKTGPVSVNGSGVVTNVPRATGGGGQNYGGGLNLVMWYGPAGANQPGSLHPGSGVGGYGNFGSGQFTSVTLTSGGSGHDPLNPPLGLVGGAGTAATGFGTNTTTYGPSLIVGVPAVRTPSVLLIGDSNCCGYDPASLKGDLKGNIGFWEQAMANQCGVQKFAVSGETAAGWLANSARQLAFLDNAIKRGLRHTHAVVTLGTNDFLTNLNSNATTAILGYLGNIRDRLRQRGILQCHMGTILPANSSAASSNKFTTTAEQTPRNVNYQAGGRVDQFNAALLAGTGITREGVIDVSAVVRDAAVTSAWKVDAFPSFGTGLSAFCDTGQGVHPTAQVGIPYIVKTLNFPTFAV